MFSKEFLIKIYDSANMRRWNDKICPVEMRELDKQAHKMVIAYMLGKWEEDSARFDWQKIIEGGIFEFLQRLIVTDLKPQIFHKIKRDVVQYQKLNQWVFGQLSPLLSGFDPGFMERFKQYFEPQEDDIHRQILNAAHFYATRWEFDILERANPHGYEMATIRESIDQETRKYYGLKGILQLNQNPEYPQFIDMCAQLRFQIRWSHLNRIPRTSILGHSFMVALLSYLMGLQIHACSRRNYNNFFTGLFHDLPEVLTRDIINPVKKSVAGLDQFIKTYEKEEMEEKIYRKNLVPLPWQPEMRLFTENEFDSIIIQNGKTIPVSSDEISRLYNENQYHPRDGEIVKVSDDLNAFIEAYLAKLNGSPSPEFDRAMETVSGKYTPLTISGIALKDIYSQFVC